MKSISTPNPFHCPRNSENSTTTTEIPPETGLSRSCTLQKREKSGTRSYVPLLRSNELLPTNESAPNCSSRRAKVPQLRGTNASIWPPVRPSGHQCVHLMNLQRYLSARENKIGENTCRRCGSANLCFGRWHRPSLPMVAPDHD